MTHKMILATADLSKIYKVVVARRKTEDCRVSSDGRAVDSYPTDSDSISLPGSTSEEHEDSQL
jgi:hypothetical protein